MKKNVVTFVFAVSAMLFTTEVSAQEGPVSYGFKAGTNLSNYRLGGNLSGSKSKMSVGGSVGGFAKVDLSTNLALQVGIDAYYKSSKLESPKYNSAGKFKSYGVEVPLFAIVQGGAGSGNLFIGAGPYIGYGLSAKSGGVNHYKDAGEIGKPTMKRFDYGFGGIAGFDINENWQINGSYQFGLTDLDEANGSSMKSQGASIGVSYSF